MTVSEAQHLQVADPEHSLICLTNLDGRILWSWLFVPLVPLLFLDRISISNSICLHVFSFCHTYDGSDHLMRKLSVDYLISLKFAALMQ